jgi:serine protease Do
MVENMKKIMLIICLMIVGSITIASLNKETVDKVKRATVFIMIANSNNSTLQNPEGRGSCSGFVINAKGYIVTNYHCVHKATELKLVFYDKDDWNIYEVVIIGIDPLADLAVIHIPKRKKALPYLNWSTEEPWDGMDVFAVGHPFGMVWSISKGVISNHKRIVRSPYVRYLQTDAVINQGNSGGPLVNTAGNVVGINSMIINPTSTVPKTNIGIALAVRSDDAKEVVDVLVKGEEFIRAIIGVRLVNLTPLNRPGIVKMLGVIKAGVEIPNTFGVIIAPTDDLPEGLENFDTIVGINGKAVNRQRDLTDVIRIKKVGDTVDLLLIRNRIYKNVTITLKKLEVTGAQLFDKKAPPALPNPNVTPKPKSKNYVVPKLEEPPKEKKLKEKPNEEIPTEKPQTTE